MMKVYADWGLRREETGKEGGVGCDTRSWVGVEVGGRGCTAGNFRTERGG